MKSKYATKKPYRTKREQKRDQELRDLDNRIHELEENNQALRAAVTAKFEAPIRNDLSVVLRDLTTKLDALAAVSHKCAGWMDEEVLTAVMALVPYGKKPAAVPATSGGAVPAVTTSKGDCAHCVAGDVPEYDDRREAWMHRHPTVDKICARRLNQTLGGRPALSDIIVVHVRASPNALTIHDVMTALGSKHSAGDIREAIAHLRTRGELDLNGNGTLRWTCCVTGCKRPDCPNL